MSTFFVSLHHRNALLCPFVLCLLSSFVSFFFFLSVPIPMRFSFSPTSVCRSMHQFCVSSCLHLTSRTLSSLVFHIPTQCINVTPTFSFLSHPSLLIHVLLSIRIVLYPSLLLHSSSVCPFFFSQTPQTYRACQITCCQNRKSSRPHPNTCSGCISRRHTGLLRLLSWLYCLSSIYGFSDKRSNGLLLLPNYSRCVHCDGSCVCVVRSCQYRL